MMERYLAPLIVYGAAFLVAALLLVAAGGFLGAAVYLALCEVLAPPEAALLTGILGLVLAVLVVVIGRVAGRVVGRSERQKRTASADTIPRGLVVDLGMLAGERAASLARAHLPGTLAASLAAGFAVGASPNLRRLLRDLLEI